MFARRGVARETTARRTVQRLIYLTTSAQSFYRHTTALECGIIRPHNTAGGDERGVLFILGPTRRSQAHDIGPVFYLPTFGYARLLVREVFTTGRRIVSQSSGLRFF